MKKTITFLVTTIICIGLSTILLAQEKDSKSPIISISKEAKTKLKAVQTIAIFLNGNNSLLTRIVEDTLGIHLSNSGFMVTSREILEKTVGEEMTKKRKEKVGGAVSALEVGKAVNADSILTGTVIIESGEGKSLLIKIASFQLADVTSGENLLNILFEPEKGKSFSGIAQEVVDILKQNME